MIKNPWERESISKQLIMKIMKQNRTGNNSVHQIDSSTRASQSSYQQKAKRKAKSFMKISMVRVKNKFEEDRPNRNQIHIPANSISNDSFDFFNSLKNQTLDSRGRMPYRENMVELSESSISPTRDTGTISQGYINKSPLYSLNPTNARAEKYKTHLLNKYKSHIERSNSANTAGITEWDEGLSFMNETNYNLATENERLAKEVQRLATLNTELRQ